MATRTFARPGGTDPKGDVYVDHAPEDLNRPGGTFAEGAPAEGEGPFPIGKSSDYQAREAATLVTPGGRDVSTLEATREASPDETQGSTDQVMDELPTTAVDGYVVNSNGQFVASGSVPDPDPGPDPVAAPVIKAPNNGEVVDNPTYAISGDGAIPYTEVELWDSDRDQSTEAPDATTLADGEGNFIFDGTTPVPIGDTTWTAVNEGAESSAITVTYTPPASGE